MFAAHYHGVVLGYAASAISLIIAAVGTAVSIAGAVSSAQSQKAAAEFNAKVARNNAATAQLEAEAAARQVSLRNRRLAATQTAAMAAAGLDITSDSGESVKYDSALTGELNRLTALYKGTAEATNFEAKARAAQQAGDDAMTAGYFGAGSALLQGASSMYSQTRSNPSFSNSYGTELTERDYVTNPDAG